MTINKLNTIYENFIDKNNLEEVDCETLLHWGEVNEYQKNWLERFKNIWIKIVNKNRKVA